MKYENIVEAIFLERPNRFIAYVQTAGEREICHVKNTGRCKELLQPGATVYVERNDNQNRKTPLDLIGVLKGERLINMDSQAPNKVVAEWLKQGNLFGKDAYIRPECRYGNSRFDFYVETGERKIFMEVKGVTLEDGGIVRFPDAPTQRGIRHIQELCECRKEGYEAYLFFVIQMENVIGFEPNEITHPEFGAALREADRQGVQILAYDCKVSTDTLEINREVEVYKC